MNLWLRHPIRMWRSRRAYERMMDSLCAQCWNGQPLRVSVHDYIACKPYIRSDFTLWMQHDGKLLTPFGPATVDRGPAVSDR